MGVETDKIVDEVCACGHRKTAHHPLSIGGTVISDGHGACKECKCSQFSWVDFVFEGEEGGEK